MFLFATLSLILIKCDEKPELKARTIFQTPVTTRINKVFCLNDTTLLFCGGEKSLSGYIFRSSNKGITWTKVFSSEKNSLYDILFINNKIGYCCGEDMLILQTTDGGLTWEDTGNKINSDNFFNGSLYCIFGNSQFLFFVGGKNFNIGIMNWVEKGKISSFYTGFKGVNNELRCGLYAGKGNYLVLGYGTIYKTKNARDATETSFDGGFFTSAFTVNEELSYACSYNGGVYKILNQGEVFKKIFGDNKALKKQINFNSILFANYDYQIGWVVGNKGEIYETTNGNNFKKINLDTKEDLLSLSQNKSGEIFVSTSGGKIISF